METRDIIREVFRKNRLGVRVIDEIVRSSYIGYALERVSGTEVLTEKRMTRIRDDLSLRLGYTPDIREDRLTGYIMVYVKNPSPYYIQYHKSAMRYYELGWYYLPFTPGVDGNAVPIVADFYDSPLVLIDGEDGYGKTNLIKIIIESSRPRGNVKYIIVDLSGGGYRKSEHVTVYRDRDSVPAALEELDREIKRRRDAKKEEGERGEEKSAEDIVFIIDGYSALCTTEKEAGALMRTVKRIKQNGRGYGVFLVLSSPCIPEFFDEEFVSLFDLVFTFRMKDEKESYLLLRSDDYPLPLYESGDAFLIDNIARVIARIQCFKLR